MKNKFLHYTLGIAAIIFAAGFFLRSIAPAQAAPTPDQFIQEGTNKIGKYQMALGIANDPDQIYYNILVWDTETGKSQFYGYSRANQVWNAWNINLPEQPIK